MELLVRKPGTARPSHEEGDIFGIYDDGYMTEPPSPNSVFWCIKIPGINKADFQNLLEGVYQDDGTGHHWSVIYRRRRKIPWGMVPAGIIAELEANCQYTVTQAQWNFIVSKIQDKLA